MKRFPKFLQPDSRGQLVIPKEIREALNIDETTGFIAYLIDEEGIFLKKTATPELTSIPEFKELKDKAEKLHMNKKHMEQAEQQYKKEAKKGGFEEV